MSASTTGNEPCKENVTSNLDHTRAVQKRPASWQQSSGGVLADTFASASGPKPKAGVSSGVSEQLLPGIIRLCRRLSPRFGSRTRSITAGENADSKIKQQPIAALTTLEPLPPIEKFVPQRLPYTRPQHAPLLQADQGVRRGSFERGSSWECAPVWLHTPTARRLFTGACLSNHLICRLQSCIAIVRLGSSRMQSEMCRCSGA